MTLLLWLALVSVFLGLIGIYVFNVFALKSIIRDIAYSTRYFCKTYDTLTNEAIKNITWKEHDRLFWVVTSTWMLSMIFGALITLLMIEIFS
jgi:hypothetical protein